MASTTTTPPIAGAPQQGTPGMGTMPVTPTSAPPVGAPLHGGSVPSGDENHKSLHHKGREKIPWGHEVWERIDQAVQQEMHRTRIGARFLPMRRVPPKTTSVPSDTFATTVVAGATPVLTVDEGATTRLNEFYVEFELTPQQVQQETGDIRELGHSTAVTLATRAANVLAQAEDLVVFQGQNAITTANPFTSGSVLIQGALADSGLLNLPIGAAAAGPLTPAVTVVPVNPLRPAVPGVVYGPNTFEAVVQAYSELQALGHYGPYALVLETIPYADTYAPLPVTLIVTADRIRPLMTAGFFGTGTLPPNPPAPPAPPLVPPYYGVLVSLGGNTVDLVVGLDPIAAFMQEDLNGNFRFRVLERFALRVKDTTGIVVLQFN